MTLMELKRQLKGKYPAGSAQQLEKLERDLEFAGFDSQTALELGSRMVRLSRKYGEGIAVRIIRELDGMTVFQYVEDDRLQRNIDFAMKKRNTVLKTGHCSLWAMAQEQTQGGLEELFQEENGCLPVGGAWPVYAAGELAATIAVSGLHQGMDHQLIIEALTDYFHKEMPEFSGVLV